MTFLRGERILNVFPPAGSIGAARRLEMRYASMFFALLICSAGLAANAQAGASHPLYVQPPASQACPVGLSADREPGGPLQPVGTGSIPRGQGLQINFISSADRAIVKADILVHGVKSVGREGLLLTRPTSIGRHDTESFQVEGTAAAPLMHPLIWTNNMTAISWLELTRIEYADGRVWQTSAESRCVAAPSLYVLVDTAAR
jgi:hypothetical protein